MTTNGAELAPDDNTVHIAEIVEQEIAEDEIVEEHRIRRAD